MISMGNIARSRRRWPTRIVTAEDLLAEQLNEISGLLSYHARHLANFEARN